MSRVNLSNTKPRCVLLQVFTFLTCAYLAVEKYARKMLLLQPLLTFLIEIFIYLLATIDITLVMLGGNFNCIFLYYFIVLCNLSVASACP